MPHSSLADVLEQEVAAICSSLDGATSTDHAVHLVRSIASGLRTAATDDRALSREVAQAHVKSIGATESHVDRTAWHYGVIGDCIYDRLITIGATPTLREMRFLSDCIAFAIAESVATVTARRFVASDAERNHLTALLEQAPGFVAVLTGREARFEFANAAYHQIVGHRELVGRPVREALPELVGQGLYDMLEQVMTTGEPYVGRAVPAKLQCEPGAPLRETLLDFIYQPIRDEHGTVTGVFVQGHDVSEAQRELHQRQLVEQDLRASEQRYRTLFSSIDDGFCLMQMIVDDAGKTIDYSFLEANASFERHTGLVNAVGKTARELVPDLDSSWFETYGRVADTGEPARFEGHAPAMDGRWFDVFASRVGEPELRQVALVFKDVTASKKAEQERAELLASERAARQEAENAARLRDHFLATVSHELRTPLAAILGWAQMLRAGSLGPEKAQRAIETIERNARAQAQLIEDLLDVSRILAGQLRIDVDPFDMKSAVEAAIETVRPAAEAKDIRIQATLASGAIVMGDAARLQQVAWNLLSNAVKFTPKHGRIQVTITVLESSVELVVADTGKGIPPSFQPFVFDRFRQADSALNRAHGGLGLGLSIVRELVGLHGGTVSVESEGEGQGSTFRVRLPLSVTRRRSPSPATGVDNALPTELVCPAALEGMRVVVVDDEADTREMVETLLANCKVIVRVADSAAAALDLIRTDPPDVLVSDIGMPGDDGFALIAKLRALPVEEGGTIPAVALTAYARSEDRTRALHSGFDNHVAKPVEPTELLAVIAAFARRRTRRE